VSEIPYNAALIAAAPDMYEALEKMVAVMAHHTDCNAFFPKTLTMLACQMGANALLKARGVE